MDEEKNPASKKSGCPYLAKSVSTNLSYRSKKLTGLMSHFFSLVLLVKKRQHVNELRVSGDVFRKSDAKLQHFYKLTKLFYIFFAKKAISD